jgi:hypothetical protein
VAVSAKRNFMAHAYAARGFPGQPDDRIEQKKAGDMTPPTRLPSAGRYSVLIRLCTNATR